MTNLDSIRERKHFSPREVAFILSLSPKTIYNWLGLGKIRGKKFGNSKHGRVRIPREELENVFKEQSKRMQEDANKKEKEWELRHPIMPPIREPRSLLEKDECPDKWRG